jgi:Diacylglycerol kinase catalytic domain
MASVRATNPAQSTSMRTAEALGARRVPSGLPDVRVRSGGVRTRPRAPSNATTTGAAPHSPPDCPLPAAVVNPSNIDDLGKLRAQITGVCAELEWAAPLWLETTVEDPGGGQAKLALAAGADMVLVCGGDGTIRQVAQVLAGSGTALGLVPAGTSNVLARNLAIGLNDPAPGLRCPAQTARSTSVG